MSRNGFKGTPTGNLITPKNIPPSHPNQEHPVWVSWRSTTLPYTSIGLYRSGHPLDIGSARKAMVSYTRTPQETSIDSSLEVTRGVHEPPLVGPGIDPIHINPTLRDRFIPRPSPLAPAERTSGRGPEVELTLQLSALHPSVGFYSVVGVLFSSPAPVELQQKTRKRKRKLQTEAPNICASPARSHEENHPPNKNPRTSQQRLKNPIDYPIGPCRVLFTVT